MRRRPRTEKSCTGTRPCCLRCRYRCKRRRKDRPGRGRIDKVATINGTTSVLSIRSPENQRLEKSEPLLEALRLHLPKHRSHWCVPAVYLRPLATFHVLPVMPAAQKRSWTVELVQDTGRPQRQAPLPRAPADGSAVCGAASTASKGLGHTLSF